MKEAFPLRSTFVVSCALRMSKTWFHPVKSLSSTFFPSTVVKEFYPDFYADLAKELTEAEVIALYDVILDSIIRAMDRTASETRNLFSMDPMAMMLMMNQPVKATPRAKSEDDILNDFINKICQ